MACGLHVTWDERLTDYHFGPGHPLAPVRVELTMRFAHEFGLRARHGVTVGAPARATDAELELVHDPGYIAAVRTVSGWAEDLGARGLEETHLRYARTFGLGTGDNPVFPGMHQASALVAGATLAAARAVWPGPARPSRAACITRWPRMPAGSASATTPRPRSPGCWDAAPSASPTWTLTRTTATGAGPVL
jgi:acetoin utilization deacetylase AcuC-like enzyme